MSHGSARLTVHGRRLIVERDQAGWKQAHIAAAMGVSRKCVKTWIDRYMAEGDAGLVTRSSRPHSMPTKTNPQVEARVLAARTKFRDGPDVLGPKVDVPPRTVSPILRRHQVPYLRDCDPMTGEVIRSSKQTAVRYEHGRPGELVHMDVKKLGKIPPGGGWRALGRGAGNQDQKTKLGYDFVHSLVDDHSPLPYSEILPDEKGPTCAGFLQRAAAYFAGKGHPGHRTAHDRQRHGLPLLGRPQTRLLQAGSRPEIHPPPSPMAERESRTTQPHPCHGMGLPPSLHQQRTTHSSPCPLA